MPKINQKKNKKEPFTDLQYRKGSLLNLSEQSLKRSTNPSGVVIVAPDGELLNIGKPLLEEYDREKTTKKDENLVYRLYDEIPPYLYYTYKLDDSVMLSYDNSQVIKGKLSFKVHQITFILKIIKY